MPKTQKVKQERWIRGVNAAAQPFAQPPGSFPRASNFLYHRRGSLTTCDGTSIISSLNGTLHPVSDNIGPFTEIALYQPQGEPSNYYAIAKDYNTHLAAPAGLAIAAGSAGVLNGTYKWVVTALDGAGGETTASSEITQTLASQKGVVMWTAVPNATGYNVYRTQVGGGTGTERFSGTSATNSYTDNVADGSLTSQVPPGANNTQVCQFYGIPLTSFGAGSIVKTLPADLLPRPGGGSLGGWGGGTGGGTSGNQPPTAAGGVSGNLSSIPQILSFNDLMILILGNGVAPYQSDGTTGNTIALVNNFQASYGSRSASTIQNVGDQISATVSGTDYIFTCTQAGTTGSGGPPSFSATLGSIVVDGTVYWKNTGAVATATPPRGAAHGIVYAGSLWVANTSPTTTSDNFDGPSCLKMSDLNNPNSWNPLNVAFLDRDDGTQVTGLATFTLAESGIPPTGSLVVFKDFSTFQVNGVFGASDFSIQRAQTDMGCVAPRSIQFVPGFGIVRLTHLGFALFDGVRDRLISEEIRPYIFGGQPDIIAVDWNYAYFSKAAQTSQPPMYCCAVPLLQSSLPLYGVVAAATAATSTLSIGSYYVIVVEYLGNGTQKITSELGPVVISSNALSILMQFPAPSPFHQKWRVYYGVGSGNENQYVDVTSQASSVAINAPGTAALFPPSTSGGQLTRLLCYDLVLKAWAVIDLPFAISTFKQFRISGSIPLQLMGGFSDGGIRRWLGGAGLDTTWDTGATNAGAVDVNVRTSVRSPQVFGKEASDRVYFRQLAVRGVTSPAALSVQATTNGLNSLAETPVIDAAAQEFGNGNYVAYLDIGITGLDAYATLSTTGPTEIQGLDWACVPKDIRARVAI
jgi:hypothetical protein